MSLPEPTQKNKYDKAANDDDADLNFNAQWGHFKEHADK